MTKKLVLGASGATGRLLVQQLRLQGAEVVALVRDRSSMPAVILEDSGVEVLETTVAEMPMEQLAELVGNCDSVLSCLGHNLTFKGMFGQPRRLVADAVSKVCEAALVKPQSKPIRFVLMNTMGNANADVPEIPPLSQRVVVAMVRALIPAHVDNEEAADYLRVQVGQQHSAIQWAAVRPDSLTDEDSVTAYDTMASPSRNAIFDAAPTSRINVANFMARLACDNPLWEEWQGQMPVIYNQQT